MDRRIQQGAVAGGVLTLAIIVAGIVVLANGSDDGESATENELDVSDDGAVAEATDDQARTDVQWDVEWSGEATIVGEDQLDLVTDADTDNHVYRLDASATADADLDLSPGRVLVIHGTALRRIAGVDGRDGELIVETEFATLPEAIENGTIEWDHEVRFEEQHFQAAAAGEGPLQLIAHDPAGGPGDVIPAHPTWTGEALELQFDMDGYRITYRLVPQGDRLEVAIIGEKDMGEVGARISATGVLESFETRDRIEIAGGELREYDNNVDNVRGELDLELVVAASGSDGLDFNLPAPILSYGFLVGYIPVTLNIDTQFIINMEVPADGSSRIQSSFSFDSDLGFIYEGTDVEADGSLGALDMDAETHETGASGAISANFGIGFPRVQLGLFGNLVVPWAQTAFLIGGSYTAFPACQTADILFLGAGGIDLRFLGPLIDSPATTFYREEEPLLRAGDCPDD